MNVRNEPDSRVGATTACPFEPWFEETEPRLRAALIAEFGPDLGRDATAEALSYAWEHRQRVLVLSNPSGYVFRVGQRWARRQRSRHARTWTSSADAAATSRFEPGLEDALRSLSTRQRQVVVLCIGYGLTHAEAAQLLGISRTSIQNHAERGLRRLQKAIGS